MEEITRGEVASVSDASDGEDDGGEEGSAEAAAARTEKKKSKKARFKKLIGGTQDAGEGSSSSSNPASKLTPGMVDQLLEMNPSLKGEVAGLDKSKAVEALKKLDVSDLLTGMSINGKNQKDMASYKFWQTQPVPRFGIHLILR